MGDAIQQVTPTQSRRHHATGRKEWQTPGLELDREDGDEQQAEPEGGDGKPADRESGEGVIDLAAAAQRAGYAERDRDHHAEQDRGDSELEGGRQPVEDVAGDEAAVDHRPAEIAMDD